MPQLPPVPGVVQLVLDYVQDGQDVKNVLHYANAELGGPIDGGDAANLLRTTWAASIRPLLAPNITLERINATALWASSGPGTVHTTSLPAAGSYTGNPMPNSVCLCMSTRTALRGRSYRGRIYHPGLNEDQVTNNTVNGSVVTSLLAAYEAIRLLEGGAGGAVYQLQVVSYYTQGQMRTVPATTPVTSISTDGYIDSQRRRLPGRGR